MKLAYVHNVCMHYKVPMLQRLGQTDGIELVGIFGQSHWKKSKLKSVSGEQPFRMLTLPTLDVCLPYHGRQLHLFYNPTLYRTLKREQPDVVVVGNSNTLNHRAVLRYARVFDKPYIWHGIGSMYKKRTLLRRLFRRKFERFFTGAAGGIAFNGVSKQYYVDRYGIAPDRIAVVPNVVDTGAAIADRDRYAQQVDAKRAELGLEGKQVILFVGAIDPAKRLDRLLHAYDNIRAKTTNTALLIVGDGTAMADVRALAEKLELPDVVFAGKQITDANLYYMLGDVFVLPGLGGLSISQAMAHNLPVVSAPADGTERDLIAHGENGYLLDPAADMTEQIVEHVCGLLADETRRRAMGEQSGIRIRTRYGLDQSVILFAQAAQRFAGGMTTPQRSPDAPEG